MTKLDKQKLEPEATRRDGRDWKAIAFGEQDLAEMEDEAVALSVNRRDTRRALGCLYRMDRYRRARTIHKEHDYQAIQNINAIRIRCGGTGLGVGRDGYGVEGIDGDRCGPLVRLIQALFEQLGLPNCPSASKIQEAAKYKLPTE
jgi:hypothetical protein